MSEYEQAAMAGWPGMSLAQFRTHAAWVWHDYTHTSIRGAHPSEEYARAVRAELLRREREEGVTHD